jgi:hypothetical protein
MINFSKKIESNLERLSIGDVQLISLQNLITAETNLLNTYINQQLKNQGYL